MFIREMRIEDLSNVKQIAKITWKDTYSSIIPLNIQEETIEQAYSVDSMTKRFETSLMLVAVEKDKIEGYAFLSYDNKINRVHLESLYVHPEHQQKGIGQLLMDAALMKYSDCLTITLTILDGNSSIEFYKKLGFIEVEKLSTDFNGYPVTFIKMKKGLVEKGK